MSKTALECFNQVMNVYENGEMSCDDFQLAMHTLGGITDPKPGKIRIWKLGSKEDKVMPGPEAFQKFSEAIQRAQENNGGEIVWDEYLSVETFDL